MEKKSFVFMDIDGTLVVDGSTDIADDRRAMVKTLLSEGQEVVLLSNKKNHERNANVAVDLGIKYLKTNLRKPNPTILNLIDFEGKILKVYGDKYWTDGRFAKKIGADFIKVERLRGTSESFGIKLSYLLDDIFAKFFS